MQLERAVNSLRDLALGTRVFFVAGKGGVGKTTVSILLARRLFMLGRRVLFVSLGHVVRGRSFLEDSLPAAIPRMEIDGREQLDEYLARHLSPWVQRRITGSESFRRFAAVAPGLEQLMSLGRICDEERALEASAPRWEAIVVDGPPAGHALEYLAMPVKALETFGPGLVTWEVKRMLAGLQSPERSQVFPVTIPEETPIAETEELLGAVERLGFAIGAVFVNRVRSCPIAREELEAASAGASARAALRCARIEATWASAHRARIARLRAKSVAPVIELPEIDSANDVARLGGDA